MVTITCISESSWEITDILQRLYRRFTSKQANIEEPLIGIYLVLLHHGCIISFTILTFHV